MSIQPEAARTEAVTFDELLGWLAQENLIDATVAQDLFERQELQLARMVRERRISQKLPPGKEQQVAASISPIELLLSFGVRDHGGQLLKEDAISELYARRIGLPYVKLDPLELDGELVTSVFSKPFARKHTLLAIGDDGHAVTIATSNPFDQWALESVERVTQKPLALVIASKSDIQRLITEFYGFRGSVKRAEQKLSESVDLGNLEQFVRMKTEREIESSDQHVVHAVEYMLNYAFQQRASDIHVEPKRSESSIRFRIDGSLHEVNRLPKVVHGAVINRIKTLSRLDIGEKRRPQDGRIKTEFDNKPVEIRVSTLPVAFGEKAVLRIFDPEIVTDDLSTLGFYERELTLFNKLISQPNGIILVTGPTGSGKTTTLYTALRKRASDDVNITTIEDPIEMVFERINQTAVNPAVDLGFAETLRTILRQDPDIIMVGEIRDLETARSRHPGFAHRASGFFDAAHQRCAERDHAADGSGRRALLVGLDAERPAGATPRQTRVQRLQSRTRPRRERVRDDRHSASRRQRRPIRQTGPARQRIWHRLRRVPAHRLSRPFGDL